MKKIYEAPNASVVSVEYADILTVSGGEKGIGKEVNVSDLGNCADW